MCGRYTLSTPGSEVARVFGLTEVLELEPRFNIAPTQEAPIVRQAEGRRWAALCRWGLVPYWAGDASVGSRLINARGETLFRKAAYKDSFERRRCLVVADGFYEWRRRGRHKQPFFFSHAAAEPFAIAGLWSRWRGGPTPLESFALVTTEANREVAAVHDRMPVLLPAETWGLWLDGDNPGDGAVRALLRPAPDGSLVSRAVSTFVNSPANDSSRCVEAIDLDGVDAGEPPRLF
jgi:putative SOS response-associated peptidase YedK